MPSGTKKICKLLVAVCICGCVLPSFAQKAVPKPGETIDASNYKQYAHLFPDFILKGFEDGWGKLMKPISLKVVASKPHPLPKPFLTLSEKNRGKFGLDKDSYISGGYNEEGLPFPELDTRDKDFAVKAMWNYNYKYNYDDIVLHTTLYDQRKGESIRTVHNDFFVCSFANRLYQTPKGQVKTPNSLFKATIFRYTDPPGLRNLTMLMYRYRDPRRADDMYIYLPTMRRVLRGEAGARSTPVQGSVEAPDDFWMFDARVADFTYTFVGEQQVLAVPASRLTMAELRARTKGSIPFADEDWEVKDVYVIDVKPKDPRHPQSVKRLYMDKDNYNIYYSAAWDRAGKLWKVWIGEFRETPLPDGSTNTNLWYFIGHDLQFGLASLAMWDLTLNNNRLAYGDFTTSTLLKMGQ